MAIDYANQSDEILCGLVCDSDQLAFAELVTRHNHRFFQLAVRTLQSISDAEDVVQLAFIKYWEKPSLFKADKAKFTTWFYRVVLNRCKDLQRSLNSSDANFSQYLENCVVHHSLDIDDEESALIRRVETMENQVALEYAIRQLSISQRDAINLVIYSELPQKQAAEVLGISLKALESTLVRAKKKIVADVKTFLQKRESENHVAELSGQSSNSF
ncbi:MAG: sigma-70 family RNA polymerase sigma factor [Pseudomonadota bacterium]